MYVWGVGPIHNPRLYNIFREKVDFYYPTDSSDQSRRLQLLCHQSPATISVMSFFRTYLNSPVGPKTTHFWGPVANWGFVAAAMADLEKPPEMVSGNMTVVMCVYSALCMRFAWMIRPRNYLLLGCHASNETVQLYQLSRWARGQGYLQKNEDKAPST